MAYSPSPNYHERASSFSDRSSMSLQGHHLNDEGSSRPHSPTTPDPDQPLLGDTPGSPYPISRRQTNSSSPLNFVSSPLNPRANIVSMASSTRSRGMEQQGKGVSLWNMANSSDSSSLLPPRSHRFSQFSMRSTSDASIMSHTEDSKYPQAGGVPRPLSGLIAYAYDPLTDQTVPDAEEDKPSKMRGFNYRGIGNVSALVLVSIGVVMLFTFYPIFHFLNNNDVQTLITGNVRINGSGQAPELPNLPQLVDVDTPENVKTRKGYDGHDYELVFSDEFNVDNRTFFPGDDPFWEAVDIWYWATADLEWYDPRQVTTRDGKLVLTLEQITNHNLGFRSGMLQSWNKFCFTGGYIEVSLSLPGRNDEAQGYWPGAWIMGNLGRPGYGATTDGMWPYSYDACDLGTFPNQTLQDKSGPPAALHTDKGREKYNFELSWLTGQRLSQCTCPNEDHPGPVKNGRYVGRGVPEIDILEAQKNKHGDGAKVSQSLQMAPFNADYQANWGPLEINNPELTARNDYNGSAVQQAISCLTTLPERIFHGTGGEFATLGFEYWANPDNRDEGFVTWQSDGERTFHAPASMLLGDDQSQISARIMPEEPMSIIFNLAISQSFQTVDLTTLDFPAEFLVDYVRVYQRKGQTNIGCDGKDRPTTKYIEDHIDIYSNPNLTFYRDTKYTWPKNGAYHGGC